MEKTLYNKNGQPVAYVAADYARMIYLWDGEPVAYIYEELHVYGINGQHLGWFKEDVLYTPAGERVGFTSNTCAAAVGKSPQKNKKAHVSEPRPRWKAPPSPQFSFRLAVQDLRDFLKQGRVTFRRAEEAKESTQG